MMHWNGSRDDGELKTSARKTVVDMQSCIWVTALRGWWGDNL